MRVSVSVVIAAVALNGVGCVQRTAGGGWSVPNWAESKSSGGTIPTASAEDLPGKESGTLCLNMAESLEKDGKESEAIAYYERARTLDPSLGERSARRLAVLYDRHDDQAKALTEFQALLKKRPKDANLLNDIGYSHYNRGQWVEAETHLRKAVAADKTNKRAWVNLGMALAQQGKYQEGLDAFGKVVSPAEAQSNLAFVLLTQGKKTEAIDAYKRALAFEPTLKIARAALDKLEPSETTTVVQPTGS
jgi:tetratricopeptide (TPR) repeat protein